jgi:carboxymethylenebutenolidase
MFRVYPQAANSRRESVTLLVRCVLITLLAAAWTAVSIAGESTKKPPSIQEAAETFLSGSYRIQLWRFEPAATGKYPAVLLLPGIDGLKGCQEQLACVARRLSSKGYAVFLVNYLDRTAPAGKAAPEIKDEFKNWLQYAAAVEQRQKLRNHFESWMAAIRDALSYVRRQPAVDATRVGLVGLSLGGYLAMSVAAEKDIKISAVVECFGGLETEVTRDIKGMPPTLLIHDEKDPTVPVKEAYALLGRLVAGNIPHEFQIYTGVGHVFMDAKGNFNVFAALNAESRTLGFLDKHLKGRSLALGKPRP